MPTIEQGNEIILRCACGDRIGHVAYLVYEPDDSRGNNLKGEQDDWYLSVSLAPAPFWKRLWLALKYVWRPRWYIGYSEIVLRTIDVQRLSSFIQARCLSGMIL